MAIPVRSGCHRYLRNMENYHSVLSEGDNYADYFDAEYAKKEYSASLDPDESLVGVYENQFGEITFKHIPHELIWGRIIITNKAMHLCSKNQIEKVYFKDVQEVKGPDNKQDDLTIHVRLKDKTIDLPILYTFGENGKLKDVFLFLNFLGKVIGDKGEL